MGKVSRTLAADLPLHLNKLTQKEYSPLTLGDRGGMEVTRLDCIGEEMTFCPSSLSMGARLAAF